MTRLHTLGPARSPLAYRTAAIWDPGRFQDGRRTRGYFEGSGHHAVVELMDDKDNLAAGLGR